MGKVFRVEKIEENDWKTYRTRTSGLTRRVLEKHTHCHS